MRQIGGIVLLADGVCLCALVYFTKQIFPLGYISAVWELRHSSSARERFSAKISFNPN